MDDVITCEIVDSDGEVFETYDWVRTIQGGRSEITRRMDTRIVPQLSERYGVKLTWRFQ